MKSQDVDRVMGLGMLGSGILSDGQLVFGQGKNPDDGSTCSTNGEINEQLGSMVNLTPPLISQH